MEINVSNIPSDKSPDKIKHFLEEEIRKGKLTSWDIAKIEMKAPIQEKEYQGIIYLTDPAAYPRLFTILETDSEFDKYFLSIPIQINK